MFANAWGEPPKEPDLLPCIRSVQVSDVIIDALDSLAVECGRRLERAAADAIASSGRYVKRP